MPLGSGTSKKEFVQKYLQDEYSCAIQTKMISGANGALGDYSEPLDSQVHHKKTTDSSEDYSSDPDDGYALPQDSVSQANVNSGKDFEDGNVYLLAQRAAAEEYDVPPTKKPSPKPRSSRKKITPIQQDSASSQSEVHLPGEQDRLEETGLGTYNVASACFDANATAEQSVPKKRPGKKVVEIEYEVASAIRPVRTAPSQSQEPKSSITPPPGHVGDARPQSFSPIHSRQAPVAQPNPQLNANQPPVEAESLYQEPWDLRAKRLKQEDEEKKLSKQRSVEAVPKKPKSPKSQVDTPSKKPKQPIETKPRTDVLLYEDAWDSPQQQKKLEAKLSFARSVSQSSETEIFHDALENVPGLTGDSRRGSNVSQEVATGSKPEPATYEEAWDVKGSALEKKIRKMQIQESTYEEPWDNSKQQKKLQAKFRQMKSHSQSEDMPDGRLPGSGAEQQAQGQGQPKSACYRSSSDARDIVGDKSEKLGLSRGKFHSVDENKIKAKSRGCNIGQRIDPLIPLTSQNWYHGNISRDDAEQMLRVCKEGSYIVRISSDRKSYSLSIKSSKQNIHVQIEQIVVPERNIRYILGKNSKEFCTIPEMIDYYTYHRVPLKGAEHITLLHPVECKWAQNSQ